MAKKSAPSKKNAFFRDALKTFNRHYPYHKDLSFIDERRAKTYIGTGKLRFSAQRAGRLKKQGLISIVDGRYGRYLEITSKGYRSLDQSNDAWDDL